MNTLRFILSAWLNRCAYIDLDGCLLKRTRCPAGTSSIDALAWWGANLGVTPIIKRRLLLCYLLKLLGVRLYIWTNRWPQHKEVTRQALGWHMWLFVGAYYLEGSKDGLRRNGPCMDDQKKYIGNKYADLLVEQL